MEHESKLCSLISFKASRVLISVLMIMGGVEYADAQDSLITKGKLLVHVVAPLDTYYAEIAHDTTDLSAQAQQEFDWLRGQGCNNVIKMALFDSSQLKQHFVLAFDTSFSLDTMKNRLLQNALIDTTVPVVRVSEGYYGCYEDSYAAEYINDPSYSTNNTWHVWTADQYIDADMSVTDAWEFTRSDASVVTLVDAGYRWWICEADLPKTIWRDFGEQVIEGWWEDETTEHFWTQEPPENCYCYDCDDFQGGTNYKPYNMKITEHAFRTNSIIAGQFDTTTNGSLGIAPLSKLMPVSYGDNVGLMKAVDVGRAFGAKTIIISSTRHYKDNDWYKAGWEYAYDHAVDNGVLPILAVGNDNKDPLESVTTSRTLNVSGNVGTYRSSITSYDAYPYVNISAAGNETSFAAAAAAGVAALVLSRWPDMTVSELREHLLNSVDPMLDPIWDANLSNTKLGTGRLNAYEAIATKVEGEISEDVTWSGPIYVTGDVIVKPGATLTIDLTPVENLDIRTQIRFASLSFAKPPQVIQPRIEVEGSLIVNGAQNNRILFSGLQRNLQVIDKWYAQWGGIIVKRGGSIQMEHAVVEGCSIGINMATPHAVIEDVEFCNVGRSIIVQNYDPQYGEPNISNCKIHNIASDLHFKDNTSIGIGIWRGSPQITGCDISGVDVGVHYYSWYSKGILDNNYIHNTKSHGVLCISECNPTITRNRIDENEGYGVSLMYTRRGMYLKSNVISNNGRKGLGYNPAIRTADGLYMYNSSARLHGNTIDSNRIGSHLESFSTLIGGDGTVGQYGTGGSNTFMDNDTAIVGSDHSKTLLGSYSGWDHYGHGNTMYGLTSGMQVVAKYNSDLWVQCDTWDPSTDAYFVSTDGMGSRIFRWPFNPDCWPIGHPYPDDKFELAQVYLSQKDFASAFQIYVPLAETTIDSIVLRAVNGFIEIYAADSLHAYVVEIDSLLDYVAYCNRNGADSLKANIAYAQAILATVVNDYDKADSLYDYADNYLTSHDQLRNNITSNMYLELYMQSDTTAAYSIMQRIESDYASDPLISNARDMFRYYVDIEANRYIRRQSSNDVDVEDRDPAAVRGLRIDRNYPNPFRESTVISYSIDSDDHVRITLHNILGQTVRVLQDTHQNAGKHYLKLDASAINPGTYFIEIRTSGNAEQITVSKIK